MNIEPIGTGAGAAPPAQQSLREQVARLLVLGQGMDPDERVIDASSIPTELANGRKVLAPQFSGPLALWIKFAGDADRVIDAFGERTIEAALLMVRA